MSGEFQRRAGEAWRWFRAWPPVVQFVAVAIVLAAVLALFGNVEATVSRVRDWLFDREQVEAEAERDALRVERDAALERAKTAETRAALLEEQAEALKQVAANAALSAREQTRRAEEIERATEDAIDRAGADPTTARDEYRERLRRLGYLAE
jgi:hypothetical protein